MYRKLDKTIPKLKKEIRKVFNSLSVMSFDEMNPVQAQSITTRIYERLKELNLEYYLALAEYIAEKAAKDARNAGFELKSRIFIDAMGEIKQVLNDYNLVTGYLYDSEADRKRLRLSEGLATAALFLNRELYDSTLKKSASLWLTQSVQYGLAVTDSVYINTLKQIGVDYVQWVAEKDAHTCDKCKQRDGAVYPIMDVPPKLHYGCRCTLMPVSKNSQERL